MRGVEDLVIASVVVPMYNAAATIDQQLEALAAQRADVEWELLVCDNGSTDDSRERVARWHSRIPRLRLIDASARRGPSAARNIGVAEAQGEWVLFCDADDVVDPRWIDAHMTALRDYAAVVGRIDYERLRRPGTPMLTWLKAGHLVFHAPTLPHLSAAGSGNFGIRRDVFLELEGFEESLRTAEDADLSWRLQLAGYELGFSDALVHIRVRQSYTDIARQAYRSGASYKGLEHRYAHIRQQLEPHAGSAPADPAALPSRVSRIAERMRQHRLRDWFADVIWGRFHRLGEIAGSADESVPRIGVNGRPVHG